MNTNRGFLWLAVWLLACGTLAVGACASGGSGEAGTAGSTRPAAASGARLWAENCTRCHNTRSPSIYSDSEWEVAMLHMRIRANLTAEEHEAILAFLKAAN